MNQPVDGPFQRRGADPGLNKSPERDSPDWAVQLALAAMMSSPDRPLIALIQEQFPRLDTKFYGDVIVAARKIIKGLIDTLHEGTEIDPSPPLLDRLSFTWRFLQRADVLVWKLTKSEMAKRTGVPLAEFAFRNILPVPLQDPLLTALLEWLRLGSDARYLFHYSFFRRATTPTRLPDPFSDLLKTRDSGLLGTVIWWCLRARREEYVEVCQNEPVRIEFPFVLEEVLRDLKGWCGEDIEQFPDITGEIDRELYKWLEYSRLYLPLNDAAPDANLDPEIAKAFVKHNELTTKLRIHRASAGKKSDERVRQLEDEIRQYAVENRALEERLRTLEAPTVAGSAPPAESEPEIVAFSELREVLKTIDSKYAFDTLNAVQFGEDTHLTLRSFASHLFYALRKRGFSEYPKEEQFTLTYEASGLYDCDGFEVPPGKSALVKVTRKGWALKARGRWLPVRRARVSLHASEQRQ